MSPHSDHFLFQLIVENFSIEGQWASSPMSGRPNNSNWGKDVASFVYELPEPTREVMTLKIFSPLWMVGGINPVSCKEAWKSHVDAAWSFEAEFARRKGADAPVLP